MRPTGVEPIFPASEADALSIELRARYDEKLYLYYTKLSAGCSKSVRMHFAARPGLYNFFRFFGERFFNIFID